MADETVPAASEGRHGLPEATAPEQTVVATSGPAPAPVDESAPRRTTEQEVAIRAGSDSDGSTFVREFALGSVVPDDQDHPMHVANRSEVLQDALRRGLRPTGDVSLIECKQGEPTRRGHVTTYCTYSVPVEPASEPVRS